MLRRFPTVKRWDETDDIVQMSFVRLLRALKNTQVESELHFRRLACLQVRRILIDLGRSYLGPHGLAENHETHYGDNCRYENVAVSHSGSRESLSLSDWEEFHMLVGKLEAAERDMFDLIYYSGLKKDAVAKLLGISARSVERRWRKARLAISSAYRTTSSHECVT
jgi:RNA polymerase sigma factor (sigma-70 family)